MSFHFNNKNQGAFRNGLIGAVSSQSQRQEAKKFFIEIKSVFRVGIAYIK